MTTPVQQNAPVYAIACEAYALAGWSCIIPVPPESKFPPPGGFTGADGRDTAPEDVAAWAQARAADSIALRMPDGVIGIDVDEYAKGDVVKHGATTLAAAAAELGPLPPTYSSTARGPGQPSRILFYRVPPGRYAGQLGPDVEIIQRHHRYAVVAPSPHSGTGTPYAWYGPDGSPLDEKIPGPGELPELPASWVRRLAEGAAAAGPAAAGQEAGQALLTARITDGQQPCVRMAAEAEALSIACTTAEAGSRHDAMTGAVYEVVMLAAEGHPGLGAALTSLQGTWTQVTAGEGRDDEFSGPSGFVITAARKAAGKYGHAATAVPDPCLFMNTMTFPAPAPEPASGELPQPVGPPRYWSPFGVIGTAPFDPAAGLDAPLARDVLARTWPVLRYAPDAGAWLVRGPERWDVRKGDLAKWAVDLVSWLMLPGDPAAPDGSAEKLRAVRRARFTTNAAANAIAGKINAQVLGGHHPSAADLASLDAEHEILWAGGVPYDLRASAAGPSAAWTDPGTPHLHSAGVVPRPGPAPLWETFIRAVWPEDDLRAWALRVLSVAFTGYSDKALPILLGDTDRGKTEVIKLLMTVLGSYAHVADARLLSPADRSHASIVYALKGRRLSFIDEAPRAGALAQERLKQITGGAELTGNRMAENPVTFYPTHTLILTANPEHEPKLNDPAIRRRVRLIPCNGDPAAIRAARAAIGAPHGPAWRAEAPAVLAAMMAEAARWLADPASGENAAGPAGARAAAEEIAISQDLVLGWVTEACEPWTAGTRSNELYMMFTDSCRRMAVHPGGIPSLTAWGRRLNELGYPSHHTRDGNVRPLRIRPPQGFTITPPGPADGNGSSAHPGEGSSDGFAAISAEPITDPSPESLAGQTIHNPSPDSSVKGVKGNSLSFTHTHTHTRTQENGGAVFTPSSLHNPSPDPAEPPADLAAEDATQSSQGPSAPLARKSRALKREGPDPELEGPVYPLPVIVARDQDGGLPLVLPCTPEQAAQLAAASLDALCVDCETTGYPPGHADFALRTVQLGGELTAAVLDPADPAQRAVISDLLTRARKLHAHSAAADLVPLAAAGLADADALWAKTEDSVLIAKLIDPTLAGSDENELKKLAAGLLGPYAVSPAAEKAKNALFRSGKWLVKTTPLTPLTRSGWAQVRPGSETMARYAGSDVLDLAAVLRVLPRPDEAVLAREREFQVMCARVAHQGFALDHAHIRAKIAEHEEAREERRQRVTELCPLITNPSSTKEVPAALAAFGIPLGVTEGGNPSAAKTELEQLAADPDYAHHELLRAILDYRHHVTTLGLLLEPLNVLCEHGDSRMRPVVYTINADTGRTSCVRPNGQQFSRQGGIRACVVADEGMAGISADFSGVEIRIAAALSGDRDLLAAELDSRCLACGADPCTCGKGWRGLHWMAARMVYGSGATKENRYNCKRIIFSKLFGGSPAAGSRQTGVPYEAARAVHRAFESIAPRYAEWDQQMRAYAEAGNRGWPAYSGRVIWLPRGRAHAAGNYAIQGTAREALVDGSLRWHRTRWGKNPLLPIHDELFTFVPAGEAPQALETLVACMRTEIYGVPIAAEGTGPFQAWPDAS